MSIIEQPTEAQLISQSLRAKADIIDEFGGRLCQLASEEPISLSWSVGYYRQTIELGVYCYDTDDEAKRAFVQKVVRTLGGRWVKNGYGDTMTLTREFDSGIKFELSIPRAAVCTPKKTVTRTRTIPAREEKVEEYTQVVEWDCNLVLGDKSSKDES